MKLDIDTDDFFNALDQREKESFIDEKIEWASDDAILTEFKKRGLSLEDE